MVRDRASPLPRLAQSVVLADGTTAVVRGVAAKVIDGSIDQIVYTVEKESGAWTEVASAEVQMQPLVT